MTPGDKLGPYEILALIGKGGMGEVYRARDPRLKRDVAIKVSAAQFSERFEREATAIAALNHNNICQIYDVGPNYLVMEFIEGESPKGPLPLEEALRIAHQIADALEAAHEKGITHRDLKPGNIKIKPDGTVKVLDFGLAKISSGSSGTGENSPTLTIGMTDAGMILGTASYMAPEQARAKEAVDKRADIWAFGVVLYELITGKRLFTGEDVGEILAKVIRDEPDLSGLPAQVVPLLKRCLEKDPKKRLRDIGDWELLMVDAPRGIVAPVSSRTRSRFGAVMSVAAGIFAMVAAGVSFVHFREKVPAEPAVVRFQIEPPENSTLDDFALSPDGRKLVMVASGVDGATRLWVRSLDSLEPRAVAGTEGASGFPFWSPDNRTVVFAASGQLKKIDISGGVPVTLCSFPGLLRGGLWTTNGKIVFGTSGGLFDVASNGCTPFLVDRKDSFFPSVLPDGQHFLYGSRQGVFVGSLADSRTAPKPVVAGAEGLFVPSGERGTGYLVFTQGLALMAQPFDADRLQLTGEAVPLVDRLLNTGDFSVSASGGLAYFSRGESISRLTWFSHDGKAMDTAGAPGHFGDIAISPNGKQVAVRQLDGQDDIWLMDLERNAATRFTFDPGIDREAVWSPDGSQIVFDSNRRGQRDLYLKPSSGAREEQLLLASSEGKIPSDWSPDGKYLMYNTGSRTTGSNDLWLLPMQGERKPVPYLATRFNEDHGRFSPDGRWVAYASDESGRTEIYVRPFPIPPDGGGKWIISSGGGYQPLWRRDGKELLYWSSDSKLMAVEVDADAAFKAGSPKTLFSAQIAGGPSASAYHRWDISPDGKRILVNTGLENNSGITIVLNWTSLLRK